MNSNQTLSPEICTGLLGKASKKHQVDFKKQITLITIKDPRIFSRGLFLPEQGKRITRDKGELKKAFENQAPIMSKKRYKGNRIDHLSLPVVRLKVWLEERIV